MPGEWMTYYVHNSTFTDNDTVIAGPLADQVRLEDGKTAKGIWHIQGSDNGLTPYGPLSYWTLGFLAVDFRLEDGNYVQQSA